MKLSEQQIRENIARTMDLMQFGVDMMRQNIRRALPNAPESWIEQELQRWWYDQPPNFVPQEPPDDER